MRRATRAPRIESISESLGDETPSPLEELVGRESLERFEAALARLREKEREAIILRVELGLASGDRRRDRHPHRERGTHVRLPLDRGARGADAGAGRER